MPAQSSTSLCRSPGRRFGPRRRIAIDDQCVIVLSGDANPGGIDDRVVAQIVDLQFNWAVENAIARDDGDALAGVLRSRREEGKVLIREYEQEIAAARAKAEAEDFKTRGESGQV